jgi:hypothetical protein
MQQVFRKHRDFWVWVRQMEQELVQDSLLQVSAHRWEQVSQRLLPNHLV